MAYPGGAPVTIVGGQAGGASAGTASNPFVTTAGANSPGSSQANPSFVKGAPYTFLSRGRITSSATSSTAITTVSGGVPSGATVVTVQNKGGVDVNWNIGTAAATDQVIVATTGVLTLYYTNAQIQLLQFIAASGNFDLRFVFEA